MWQGAKTWTDCRFLKTGLGNAVLKQCMLLFRGEPHSKYLLMSCGCVVSSDQLQEAHEEVKGPSPTRTPPSTPVRPEEGESP